MKKFISKFILILAFISAFSSFLITGCNMTEFPSDTEFQEIVSCAKNLKSRVAKENETSNVYGKNYKFEIDGDCAYTALNGSYRISIPYRVSNTGRNDLIDKAYYLGGSYIGTEIDYKYGIYKSWSKQRQSNFFIARIDRAPDKKYSSIIVSKALEA